MFATAILLVSLLSSANTPVEKPASPAAAPLVDVGLGLRISVPPLGQAAVADIQVQLFAFYVGFFR